MALRPTDFKSVASTRSATGARSAEVYRAATVINVSFSASLESTIAASTEVSFILSTAPFLSPIRGLDSAVHA